MRTRLNQSQADPALATDSELSLALATHVLDQDAHSVYAKGDNVVTTVNNRKGIVTLTKSDVGLSNVDNTTDIAKPLSTATVNALATKVDTSLLGANNGVATLDSGGKVTASQLPSFVDDVLEFANLAALPITGETGKIYITLDNNKTYRWSGTVYIYITSGAVESVAGKVGLVTLVKADVGLSNVDNTSDANKPVSTAQNTAIAAAQAASAPVAHVGSGAAAHAAVTTTVNGFMLATDKVKLNAITGTNTGDETATTIRTKLGITTLSGSNTGDQTTITGNAGTATALQTARTINGVAFNGTGDIVINAVDATERIASLEKGAINGVATLDGTGRVPAAQLPSYVDDVLEFANAAAFPGTGESGKIYIALDTGNAYRWSGSIYSAIINGAVTSVAGKTGTVTLVKADVGLSNVDNTSDVDKPVSTAQQTAITGAISTAATDATTKANNAQSAAISSAATDATTKANVAQANAIAASVPITHVGSGATAHAAVTTTVNGFMLASDKVKLDGFSGTNTGDETTATIRSKLGITTLSGSNTGDQTTITGNAGSATVLQTARTINGVSFNGSANITINAVDSTARVASSLLGANDGVATLDGTGKVPTSQLPSFVDDVLEFANLAALPGTGETGKIYLALDTNKAYRWSGSTYVYITSGAVDSVAGKTGIVSLVKADVGLGNVDNTSDVDKPVSTASASALNLRVPWSFVGAPNGVPSLDATGKVPIAQIPLRTVVSTIGAITASSVIPSDDTEPLVTEGTELTSITIGPSSASGKLLITGTVTFVHGTNTRAMNVSCYRGSVCLGTINVYLNNGSRAYPVSFNFYDPDFGTLFGSAAVYSIRAGADGSGTWYANRFSSGRYGGTLARNRVVSYSEII